MISVRRPVKSRTGIVKNKRKVEKKEIKAGKNEWIKLQRIGLSNNERINIRIKI